MLEFVEYLEYWYLGVPASTVENAEEPSEFHTLNECVQLCAQAAL